MAKVRISAIKAEDHAVIVSLTKQNSFRKMELFIGGIRFEAKNGLYPIEQHISSQFNCDLSLRFKVDEKRTVSIHETVDYVLLYKLVKTEFDKTETLIENLCIRIYKAIMLKFPIVDYCNVAITKVAQVGGPVEKIRIEYDGPTK